MIERNEPNEAAIAWGNAQRAAGEKRRENYLAALADAASIAEAAAAVGTSVGTVVKWRQRYPEFDRAVRKIFASRGIDEHVTDGRAVQPLVSFRKHYFGHDTPWFMADMIDHLENAEPGTFTLFLLPPEHGKTTVIEEWAAWKLTYDRSYRLLFATSDREKSSKRVQRIQSIFSPDGPCPDLVRDHGPFKPEQSAEAGYMPWTKQFFNIQGKELSDERDYNIEAQGIDYQVAGARCDALVFDDIQSLPSLNRTRSMLDKIRQDWLTRPGSLGVVFGIGTRVGPGDIYEALIEEGLVDRVVTYPAVVSGYESWPTPKTKGDEYLPPSSVEFLWPERYTPKNYLVMRKNAGEVGWERNYMQKGADAASQAFTIAMINDHSDKLRSVNTRAEDYALANPDATQLVLALDPGFGVNATMVAGLHPQGMNVLDGRFDRKLQNNGDIARVLEELLAKWSIAPLQFTHLIIEDKAFQRGLLRDDDFRTLASRYGFQIVPYTTGGEKNDPNIGVPSLSAAFEQGRIVFPGADDIATQQFMTMVRSQFTKWRPNVKGNVLTQDYVMTTWFAFIRWRKMRAYLDQLAVVDRGGYGPSAPLQHQFRGQGLPYAPTPLLTITGGVR